MQVICISKVASTSAPRENRRIFSCPVPSPIGLVYPVRNLLRNRFGLLKKQSTPRDRLSAPPSIGNVSHDERCGASLSQAGDVAERFLCLALYESSKKSNRCACCREAFDTAAAAGHIMAILEIVIHPAAIKRCRRTHSGAWQSIFLPILSPFLSTCSRLLDVGGAGMAFFRWRWHTIPRSSKKITNTR